jgi:hypothetical protein
MRSFAPGYLVWTIVHNDPPSKPSPQVLPNPKLNRSKQNLRVKGSEGKIMTDFFKSTKNAAIPTQEPQPAKDDVNNDSMIQGILDIHGTRMHFSTDSTEELRLSYVPSQVLPYGPLNFDLTRYDAPTVSDTLRPPSPTKSPTKRPSSSPKPSSGSEADEEELHIHRESKWSPDDKERIWIPRLYIEHGLPEKVAEWEKALALKKSPKKAKVKGGMLPGAMERFVSKTTTVTAPAKGNAALPSTTYVNFNANLNESLQKIPKTPRKQTDLRSENLNPLTPSRPAFQLPPDIEIPSSMRKLTTAKTTEKQAAKQMDSRSSRPQSHDDFHNPLEFKISASIQKQPIPQTPKKNTTLKKSNSLSTSPPVSGLEMPPDIKSSVSRGRMPKSIYRSPPSSPSHPQFKSLDISTRQNQVPPSLDRRWSISSSDSDSLPSTKDLIFSLMTPKTQQTKEPKTSRAVRQETPTRALISDQPRLGGFEESPGGTTHEV